MSLSDCPFCGKEAVFEDKFIWNDKDAMRCGCHTRGCRGNITNSPIYHEYELMERMWNMRTNKGELT